METDYIKNNFDLFKVAVSNFNYTEATNHFMMSLESNADMAFKYFFSRESALVLIAAEEAGLTQQISNYLGDQISTYQNINLLIDYDPALIRRLSELRINNISRGLPSIMLITQGKSGSIPISNIFNSGFNLPSYCYTFSPAYMIESWAKDFQRGGACYTTHVTANDWNVKIIKDAGIEKIIVNVRDPRQALLSLINHIEKYRDQGNYYIRSGFLELDLESKVEVLLPKYKESIDFILTWCKYEHELNILFTTFEDFVNDKFEFTKKCLNYYGVSTKYFSIESAFYIDPTFDSHFRLGSTDEWKSEFSVAAVEKLNSLIPKLLKDKFSWE